MVDNDKCRIQPYQPFAVALNEQFMLLFKQMDNLAVTVIWLCLFKYFEIKNSTTQ